MEKIADLVQPRLIEPDSCGEFGPGDVPTVLSAPAYHLSHINAPKERNQLNNLFGKDWIQETKSVWRQKGLGAKHAHTEIERLHPAPFSFQDIARLIRFFTKPGMLVLDPFVGVGSTLKAAALENRLGLGIELSDYWASLAATRLEREVPDPSGQEIWNIDVRDAISLIPEDFIDFAVTSPPYWNILTKKADHKVNQDRVSKGLATRYSSDTRDLGNGSDYEIFVNELSGIFTDLGKKIVPGRYFAIVVSDFKHKERFYPFHSDLYNAIDSTVLSLQGVTILEQTHKSLFPYGYPYAYVPNVHHQYILIFRRPKLKNYLVNDKNKAAGSRD